MFFGRLAHANLCVSKAMCRDLRDRCRINAIVCYDRPDGRFRRITCDEQHSLWLKLQTLYPVLTAHAALSSNEQHQQTTLFTCRTHLGNARMLPKRPAILLSATSWTEDENFALLLDALVRLDVEIAKLPAELPDVVVFITGKGPLKSHYLETIKTLPFRRILFCTPWLEPEDYPTLLACADIGVCLHTSSSGLDLPMKVVDMFGVGLPVLAYDFETLHELVREDVNGHIFQSSTQLFDHMLRLLKGFPANCRALEALRQNLAENPLQIWQQHWDVTVLPTLEKLTRR